MQQQSRRRLPSLHAIGRSRCVDLDETPSEPAWIAPSEQAWIAPRRSEHDVDKIDDDDEDRPRSTRAVRPSRLVAAKDDREQFVKATELNRREDLLTSRPHHVHDVEQSDDDVDDHQHVDESESSQDQPQFVTDAEATTAWLCRQFDVVVDADGRLIHARPRTATHRGVFVHCRPAARLGLMHGRLEALLQVRARLDLTQLVAQQVADAARFVAELRRVVAAECRAWNDVVRDNVDDAGPPSSGLEQLHLITDELRIHVARWSTVRRRLQADRRLRTDLPMVWTSLDAACRRLGDLSLSAIKWTRKLVRIGFRVLAHGDLDRIGQDTLWNVARGLEQFNSLASTPLRQEFYLSSDVASWRGARRRGRSASCVTLSSVLELVARERAKYAAASCVEHLANNHDFLHLVLGHGPRLPRPSWLPLALTPNTADTRTSTAVPDSVIVPDVACLPSPLVDFNRRETTFASRFLHVVCHSTNLIRPSSAAEVEPSVAEVQHSDVWVTSGDDGVEVPTGPTDRSQRKNVSWGDASLSVAVQETGRRYLTDIWRMFARHLVNFLVNLEWKATRREGRGRLGSVVVCARSATLILEQMMRQAASDGPHSDAFPVSSKPALATVSRHLLSAVALSCYSSALDRALSAASSSSPVVVRLTSSEIGLSTDLHVSTTARHLLDATSALYAAFNSSVHLPESMKTESDAEVGYLLDCSAHLLLTSCHVTVTWCSRYSTQLQTSNVVKDALVVCLADLPLLVETSRRAMQACDLSQRARDVTCPSEFLRHDLTSIIDRLESMSLSFPKHFRAVCTSAAKEFFADEMPSGREWRRKASDGLPVQHSEYIELAMEMLVQPVVVAVNQLQTDAQLTALTAAVTSLCEAWSSNILTHKIRFSYLGACQLELDVLYVRTWLVSYICDSTLRSAVVSHDSLSYIDAAVLLLKQQPPVLTGTKSTASARQQKPTKNHKHRLEETTSLNGDARHSLAEGNNVDGDVRRTPSDAADGPASDADGLRRRSVPYRDQWLALRVRGGSRAWTKFTSCFNNQA